MNSEVFVDQELSWLERGRVLLSEAEDESLPLRERVQRLATFSSSLDQFYMRGVAALQRGARAGDGAAEADGISPSEKLPGSPPAPTSSRRSKSAASSVPSGPSLPRKESS
jgi:polyphosphate kinase